MRRLFLGLPSLMAIVLLLRMFPPDQFSHYPACPFHALTGFLCPGCGASRALAALAAGHLNEALLHNSLITFAAPLLAVRVLWAYGRQQTCVVPQGATPYLFATVVIYGVFRNIIFRQPQAGG